MPNKYTGYTCLLDCNNKIRWRGCGRMMNGIPDIARKQNPLNNRYNELPFLLNCTDKLLKE